MNNDLSNAYKQMQNEERKNVFYGENDVISRPGFDSAEAFDKGIKDVREVIKDYDSLLMENQTKLKDVARDLDLFKNHPEMALPNQIDTLNNQYVSLMDNQKRYLEKQDKEKKNLEQLMEAKKEFMRETRFHYKTEAKDKVALLNEYDAKMKEMRSLEGKISMGMANGLEQARYDSLKNEVIPDMDSMIKGNNKVEKNESKESVVSHDSSIDNNVTENNVEQNISNEPVNKSELNIPEGMNPADLNVVPAKSVVNSYPLTIDEMRENGGLEPDKGRKSVKKISKCAELLKKAINFVKNKFMSKKNNLDTELANEDISINPTDFREADQVKADYSNELEMNQEPEVTKISVR